LSSTTGDVHVIMLIVTKMTTVFLLAHVSSRPM